MTTRFNIGITFIGDESEAPDDWELDAISQVSRQINAGFTSGEISVFCEDTSFRVYWDIKAEDD